ncbi:MAG: hypothetical protein COX92_00045 [Candidatus Nealsonbacteria bacterium CG_4_10_14_0_2_um_filter_40_15]|uniref:Uncharacterized protein n=1 Tax=Candidatus Nealsonbacteria bacterium CG_4_10_14_0_2_um_filter_40_15 TaxID=1974682 RepID=A0A2M7UV50_9BACT|nr:MAG: hypothetical protein COX92_00045 [Candidatus Nealsonbacteria bacterium CG_4_10_14_0_2_um_filter_40_15]
MREEPKTWETSFFIVFGSSPLIITTLGFFQKNIMSLIGFTPLEVCLYITKIVNFRHFHYILLISRLSHTEKFY